MNKYGAVLDDFGLETMLDKLMEGFVRPISKGRFVLLYLLEHSGVYKPSFLYTFSCSFATVGY